MPRLTVQVVQQDIEDGARRNNWFCPVCRALFRITGIKWVVDQTTCFPITDPNAFIPLPPEAITFISAFDATGIGKPFEFLLQLP